MKAEVSVCDDDTEFAESNALSQLVPLLESKNLVPFLVYDAVYVPLEFRDRALERFKELLKVEARKLAERIA